MPDEIKRTNLDERDSDFNLAADTGTVVFRPNHQLMARQKLRERDLQPERIFFYKRMTDDKILAFSEGDAAMMMKSSHKHILRPLGFSNGDAYAKFIKNCGVKPGEVITKVKAQQILSDAFQAELDSAAGHYANPLDQNVHFDPSFPVEQRTGFVPPK